MRIVFFCSNPDVKVGSYRIWIKDLQETLGEIGVKSIVVNPYSRLEIDEVNDVIILSKGDAPMAYDLRKASSKVTIGAINFDASVKDLPVDFGIVGSIEEADSLSSYENIIVYPLIEKLYNNVDLKNHKKTDTLKICFHGHYPHLSKFNPHLKMALEEFSKIRKIELKIITGNDFNIESWEYGKPNIEKITCKNWDFLTIKDEIQECDIGIVPNITDYSDQVQHLTSRDHGLYNTDYCIRLKNKSNAGRCFVFHQLGIPVVADLTPSNFHIMGDTKSGYLVLSKNGWLNAFKKLSNHEHRNQVAINAKKNFDKLYDPIEWAKNLIDRISRIRNE